MRVAEIMTRDVFVAEPGAGVSEVAASMLRGSFGSAIVMEGSMLVGILTERDVLRAVAARADLSEARMSEWMTADPVTARSDLDTDQAVEIMMSNGFRHLPVVEGSTLVGVVSLRDIVRTQVARSSR
jgi:CBS domain-containing protein